MAQRHGTEATGGRVEPQIASDCESDGVPPVLRAGAPMGGNSPGGRICARSDNCAEKSGLPVPYRGGGGASASESAIIVSK